MVSSHSFVNVCVVDVGSSEGVSAFETQDVCLSLRLLSASSSATILDFNVRVFETSLATAQVNADK